MSGGAGALMHALDIEVRIDAVDGKPANWVEKEEEAGNWIFDSVHALVRDVFSGRVQVDRDRIEGQSFTRTLAVFAYPSSQNAQILTGDHSAISSRLIADLGAKFGEGYRPPGVKLTPIRAFISEAAPMNAPPGQNPGQNGPNFGQQPQYGANQMTYPNLPTTVPPGGQSHQPYNPYFPQVFPGTIAAAPQDGSTKLPKGALGPTGVMMMGIVLGSLAIATVVLSLLYVERNNDFKESQEELRVKTLEASALEQLNASFNAADEYARTEMPKFKAERAELIEEARLKGIAIELQPIPDWGQLYVEALQQHRRHLNETKAYLSRFRLPGPRPRAEDPLPPAQPRIPGQ